MDKQVTGFGRSWMDTIKIQDLERKLGKVKKLIFDYRENANGDIADMANLIYGIEEIVDDPTQK